MSRERKNLEIACAHLARLLAPNASEEHHGALCEALDEFASVAIELDRAEQREREASRY